MCRSKKFVRPTRLGQQAHRAGGFLTSKPRAWSRLVGCCYFWTVLTLGAGSRRFDGHRAMCSCAAQQCICHGKTSEPVHQVLECVPFMRIRCAKYLYVCVPVTDGLGYIFKWHAGPPICPANVSTSVQVVHDVHMTCIEQCM